ncbi:MAG: LysR family transcriptional regulator [Pseudomonadota bacterium]
MVVGDDLNWDDIRYFLAVAQEGSTLKAAKRLGVSQTTVARRLDLFEQALSAKLFERRQAGYRPTPIATKARVLAEDVARAAALFSDLFPRGDPHRRGGLVLATAEPIARQILLPALARARRDTPGGLRVELLVGDGIVDLARGEADIALRASKPPPEPGLIVRRLPHADLWGVFGAPAYFQQHARPASPEDLKDHRCLSIPGFASAMSSFAWFDRAAGSPTYEPGVANISHLFPLVCAGGGLTVLPRYAGLAEGLIWCFDVPEPVNVDFWLVYQARLKSDPEVRLLIDAILAELDDLSRRPPDLASV